MYKRWGTFLACAVISVALAGCKAQPPRVLSLSIPSELLEGESADGMVTMSYASGLDVVVELGFALTGGTDGGRLTIPGGVIIEAGDCSVTFTVEAVDDSVTNSADSTYTVTAQFAGNAASAVTDTITIID